MNLNNILVFVFSIVHEILNKEVFIIFKWMYKKWITRRILKEKNTNILSSEIPFNVIKNNIGRNCVINEEVKIYKETVRIGDFTYINGGKIFYAQIGKFCSIGYNVCFGSGEHFTNFVSTFPLKNKVVKIPGLVDFPEQKDCIIGNDVWIGNNAIIKQGVTIGSGAIIASGAIVTKDVEPYSIVAGIPAKTIKYRFNDDVIYKLLSIKWWDWDISKIDKVVKNNEFQDVEQFVHRYYK